MRPRHEGDTEFLARLYASTRLEELAPIDWDDDRKLAFLRDQFDRQHAHYLQHYPRAKWWVIEAGSEPVGRIYIEQTASEIRLMDIALLPGWRGRGIGSALLRALMEQADAASLAIGLHVEPYNPVLRLYARNGFQLVEQRGVYHFLKRQPVAGSPPS